MSIVGIRSLVLHVRNLEASVRFYRDTVGLIETSRDDGMVFLALGDGDKAIPLLLHVFDAPSPTAHGLSVDLAVRDLDGFVHKIASAGYPVIQPPETMPWGDRTAVVQDPDGYQLWLVGLE